MNATQQWVKDYFQSAFVEGSLLDKKHPEVKFVRTEYRMSGDTEMYRHYYEDAEGKGYAVWLSFDSYVNENIYKLLLDPLAWQAVYKTRLVNCDASVYLDLPRAQMHNFVDYIFDGKTIEEALEAIK